MKNNSMLLFLMGLFAMTEVYVGGFSAISELIIFVVGPFVLVNDWRYLRKDGFLPMVCLFLLTILGCIIASKVNGIALPYFARGFAAIYGTLMSFVCAHRLLRNDFSKIKWFFLGYSLSLVVNIFIFQRGSARHGMDTALFSEDAMESTVGSVLFWASRLPNWLFTPIRGWFIQTPSSYSIFAAIAVVLVSLFGSGGSGRSAALAGLGSLCLLIVGGKTVGDLARLKKHIVTLLVFLMIAAAVGKTAYQHLARTGLLGEQGQRKLEEQTKHGNSALSMLMAGRGEFFAGLYCAIRNPIVGYGPWAIDRDGLSGEFLREYGDVEDYENYLRFQQAAASQIGRKQAVIPSHSCVVGFWTWYGIFGLFLWLYILRVYWKTFTTYFVCYPPWFGCIATILPLAVWDAFFSPYGNRVMMGLFFAMCLYLKAVYEKRIPPGGTGAYYTVGRWK